MNFQLFYHEFSQDRVAAKSAFELGRYIAGLAGTDEQLEQVLALVDVIKGYDVGQSKDFRDAFYAERAAAFPLAEL